MQKPIRTFILGTRPARTPKGCPLLFHRDVDKICILCIPRLPKRYERKELTIFCTNPLYLSREKVDEPDSPTRKILERKDLQNLDDEFFYLISHLILYGVTAKNPFDL